MSFHSRICQRAKEVFVCTLPCSHMRQSYTENTWWALENLPRTHKTTRFTFQLPCNKIRLREPTAVYNLYKLMTLTSRKVRKITIKEATFMYTISVKPKCRHVCCRQLRYQITAPPETVNKKQQQQQQHTHIHTHTHTHTHNDQRLTWSVNRRQNWVWTEYTVHSRHRSHLPVARKP